MRTNVTIGSFVPGNETSTMWSFRSRDESAWERNVTVPKLQVTRVTPQLTPALPSWFSAVSIAKSKSSIKRAQIFFLYILQNHRGITVSLDALCFEKWKFVKPRLSR